jgi:hypothetical protein
VPSSTPVCLAISAARSASRRSAISRKRRSLFGMGRAQKRQRTCPWKPLGRP